MKKGTLLELLASLLVTQWIGQLFTYLLENYV